MLKSGEKLQKLLMLLITWTVLLAGFVAYQQYFVKHQESFFRERGFRTLNRLSLELEHKFEEAQASTESFVKLVKWGKKEDNAGNFLNVYLQDLQSNDQAIQSARQCWSNDPKHEQVPLESKQDRDGLTLSIHCFTRASPEDRDLPDRSATKLLYTLNLEARIRKGLHAQGSDFENVLVADSSGHVALQESNAGPRIADLKSILTDNKDGDLSPKTKASSAEAAQNDGPKEGTGARDPRPGGKGPAAASTHFPELDKLNDASFFSDVTIAGEPYKMFSQPVQISLGRNFPGVPPLKLVFAGLRHSSTFASQTHALPYSIVIWAGLIIVSLFSLSWPLFKLHYMSASERFTPKDGWFLVITIVLATTSVTLILLNASYISQAQKETDTHLRALAYGMKQNFMTEMLQQYAELQCLTGTAPKVDSTPIPNYLDSDQAINHHGPLCDYPYFEIAAWMDNTGQQISKFDVRAASTPLINLKDLDFFKDVLSESKAQAVSDYPAVTVEKQIEALRQSKPSYFQAHFLEFQNNYLQVLKPTHFQPLFSPSTNEFSAVLSAAVPAQFQKNGRLKVAVLSSRPMSLMDPILPPGYKFAVMDKDCKVLFHSDSARDGRENFCDESESAGELKPWLFSGIDSSLDISYAGQTERAYLTSLDLPGASSGEAFLIVFQEPDRQVTVNLAIILVCSILLGAYALVFLCVACIHLAIRKSLRWLYAPNFIWPCREQALKYMQLAAAVGTMLLLFWILYPWLYEAPLLLLSLAVPVLSLLFGVFKLCDRQKTLTVTAVLLFALGVVGFLLSCLLKATSWRDWCWVFVFFAACGIIAYFLSGRSSLPTGLRSKISSQKNFVKDFARSYFAVLYVGAALAMITAVALAPTLGFFKYAYDAVSELALKHDQAEVADHVLDRFDRIRDYYSHQVKAPRKIQAARIQLNWDRYDNYDQTFTEKCGPQLPEEELKTTCPDDKKDPASSEAFNQQIEKWIAEATLRFPANQLGSEMSKLGVAGNDTWNEKPAWKRTWTEDDSTKFTLTWNDPRMPGFKVTSTYQSWHGLRLWTTLCLIPLAMVLGVWLMTVVKKIFLTDFEGTLDHDDVDWKTISDIRKSALIIGPAKTGKTKWLRELLRPSMATQKLAAAAGAASSVPASTTSPSPAVEWRDLRNNRTETCGVQASVLVLDHFEFNLRDRQYNLERLKQLEDLLYNSECKVLVISTVDPLFYLTEGAPEMLADKEDHTLAGRLLDRWARALSKLTRVRLKDSDEKKFLDTTIAKFKIEHQSHGKHNCCRQLGEWIAAECSHTAMLREIGDDILKEFKEGKLVTQELVVRNVLERADLYYHVLWSGMAASERLVLYQLALDGWANPKNVEALQQLERKSLISRAPMYKIMNESFRRFIESAEHADEIAQWAKNERQSTWHALRVVASAAAIGIVVWLVYSQAALSQALTGYVAGIATLFTAVASLFGRSGKTNQPKVEDKGA